MSNDIGSYPFAWYLLLSNNLINYLIFKIYLISLYLQEFSIINKIIKINKCNPKADSKKPASTSTRTKMRGYQILTR